MVNTVHFSQVSIYRIVSHKENFLIVQPLNNSLSHGVPKYCCSAVSNSVIQPEYHAVISTKVMCGT